MRPAVLCLLGPLALVACAPVEDARAAWLRHTLVLDNQDFLERDPGLAGGKFAKMSESPFAFFRGTAPQLARDLFEPGGAALRPWPLADRGLVDVALVGDAHPENIGGFRTGNGTITVDFNDFDAATYGPLELDVRRLALGFWIACVQAHDDLADSAPDLLAAAGCDDWAAAVPRGYADEIVGLEVGREAATIVTDAASHGVVLDTLLEDARADGDGGDRLADYTRVEGDRRVMFHGDIDPARLVELGDRSQLVFEDSVRPVDSVTQARVEQLVAQWTTTVIDPAGVGRDAAQVLGVVARFGAGISSYPLDRWYVLVEGPSAAIDDDVLLELKEVRDALPMPGARRPIDAPFDGNGSRVVGMQRELQGFLDDDPWLGWADDGGLSFRVRERTGYQNGFRVADIAPALIAGDWAPADLVELAATCGRMLGRSHARARRSRDGVAGPAIAAAIGDGTVLVDDTVTFVRDYGPIVLDDHARLLALLAEHGPRLGYGE